MLKRAIYIISILLTSLLFEAVSHAQQPVVYEVSRLPFNSSYYSEMAPVLFQDGLIYCSDKRYSGIIDRTDFDGKRLYNLYLTEKGDSSVWGDPAEIRTERSYLFNNGPVSVSPDGKTIYLTSEVETGKAALKQRFKNKNGILIGELQGSEIVSLQPFRYNSIDYQIAHPSISSDGKILFFASDMPGGQGRSDIYYCELVDGEWSAPVNLGAAANSPASEYYPYIHSSGKLYFASNRAGGIGLLDIYVTSFNNGEWEIPYLLPEPVNSPLNDFGLVAGEDRKSGYFTSERQRSDDIFSFKSNIIRKEQCDTLAENSYCYQFIENNAVRDDSIPYIYTWNFGDGESASGAVVEHCFSGPGTYLVQIDVTSLLTNEVMYNQKTDTLVITDIVQAYITSADTVSAGTNIVLKADETNLPGWEIAQYYWNFGNDQVSTGNEVSARYLNPGTYNVQLMVTSKPDAEGEVKETCVSKNIVVMRQP